MKAVASLLSLALSGLLATVSASQAHHQHHVCHETLEAQLAQVEERTITELGGWSLMVEIGTSCPAATATCYGNQTGVYDEFNRTGVVGAFTRGEECCPYGSSPRLDCGTYVNNGQPFACCPLDNPDCRGDVSDPLRKGNEKCANSGWALWQIPDGGFNMFCCLPDQYGYWYEALGQDAVGQCSSSNILPVDSTPATQFNNGDGSVSPEGVQLVELVVPAATPAPTCDVLHYGWSLQVDSAAGCTSGSDLCSYGGSCCPKGLTCGTVIGDSEVPVCCPPGNPDCRGDVEGLWPQLCSDSSWALWHVNTNGNHFCCKPGQIGYNVPGDIAAVGFCGSAVPNGTMRSILDYEGDDSVAGAFAKFPCDTSPAPNATLPEIVSSILNPASSLNPAGLPQATPIYGNGTIPKNPAVATIVKPWYETIYVCPAGATSTLAIVHTLSGGIPVAVTKTVDTVPAGATVATAFPSGVTYAPSGPGSAGPAPSATIVPFTIPTETASGTGLAGGAAQSATQIPGGSTPAKTTAASNGLPTPTSTAVFTGSAQKLAGGNVLLFGGVVVLGYML